MKITLLSLILLLCSLSTEYVIKVEASLNDESYVAVLPTEITVDDEPAGIPASQLPLEIDKVPATPLRNTLAAGLEHAMAIANDGSLWAWGSNSHGQVGDGTTENRFIPVKVLDNVSMVVAHNYSSMALQYDGTLWAWGDNSSGLLGDGTTVNPTKPVKVMEDVIHMDMNGSYTLIVKSDGSLWGLVDLTVPRDVTGPWARYPRFYLEGLTINDSHSPVKLIESGVKYASVGSGQFMIIKEDNSLWSWGSNSDGEVGVAFSYKGEPEVVLEPTLIMENVAYVFAEPSRTSATTMDGELWAWGIDYKLTGTRMYSDIPVMLMDNIAVTPNAFQFGIGVTADSDLLGWGFIWYSDERMEADPETGERSSIPTVESPLLLMENVTEVVMSSGFTIVKTINNELWAWGKNDLGQLGISNSSTIPPHNPIKIMDLGHDDKENVSY